MSFLFTFGLVFFSGAASPASFKKRICSAVLAPFSRANARGPTEADRIAARFYRAKLKLRFTWEEQVGLVRIDFPPNQAKGNDKLLTVASWLALAYDGTEFYDVYTFDPRRAKAPAPPATFKLFLDRALPDDMFPSRAIRPRFGAGPTLTAPRPSEMRRDVLAFDHNDDLLRRADRFPDVRLEVGFRSLEMRTTPEGVRQLRRGIAKLDRTYRRAVTWPWIFGGRRNLR